MKMRRTILVSIVFFVLFAWISFLVYAEEECQLRKNPLEMTDSESTTALSDSALVDTPLAIQNEKDPSELETMQIEDNSTTMTQEFLSNDETSTPLVSSTDPQTSSTVPTYERTADESIQDVERSFAGVKIQIIRTSINGEETVVVISGLKIVVLFVLGLIIAALLFSTTLLVLIRLFNKRSQKGPKQEINNQPR